MREQHDHLRGALCGLGAAALFGLSTPLAKMLVPQATPLLLAALLYLGAALALNAAAWMRRSKSSAEAALRRSDFPALLGIIFAGGMAGPVLMLWGLARVSGLAGSLLLNLEAPFTMVLAVGLFSEHLGRREAVAATLIVIGAALLGWSDGMLSGFAFGAAAIAAACLCWGLDNNLTQRLSLRDPLALVRVKALTAGTANLGLAWVFGAPVPQVSFIAAALTLGALSYGMSLLLDAYALRLIGAAREAAYFACAPFFGAVAAVILLGDHFTGSAIVAACTIVVGVGVLLRERHEHTHEHQNLEHDHLHSHDDHHQHDHPEGLDLHGQHAHQHTHTPLRHQHRHLSDAHHRHSHEKNKA